MKYKLYLDDFRVPVDPTLILVSSFYEFVDKVRELGLDNIEFISLDHDLGPQAMNEFFTNTARNYTLNYENIDEKTGYDAAKWLIEHWTETRTPGQEFIFPAVYVHSANPIGSANIMGYVNNFLKLHKQPQTCVRIQLQHTNRPNPWVN